MGELNSDDIKSSAQELADLFLGFAGAVRTYASDHFDELSPEQRNDLKSRVVQFEDLHDEFAADDIDEKLAQVASKVTDLKTATTKAQNALKTVVRIEVATRIVGGVLDAAQCAAGGDLGGTAQKLADLFGSLGDGADSATAHS